MGNGIAHPQYPTVEAALADGKLQDEIDGFIKGTGESKTGGNSRMPQATDIPPAQWTAANPVSGSSLPDLDDVHQLMLDFQSKHKCPGLLYSIIHSHGRKGIPQVLCNRGIGYLNLEQKIPIVPNARVNINCAYKPVSRGGIGIYFISTQFDHDLI